MKKFAFRLLFAITVFGSTILVADEVKPTEKPKASAAPKAADAPKPKEEAPFSLSNGKFRAGGDYIYWETIEGQLSLGNLITQDAKDATYVTTKNIRPSFGAKSGFKLNMGYEFPKENKWDVSLTYTDIPALATLHAQAINPPGTDATNALQYIFLKTQNYDILSSVAKLSSGSDLSASYDKVDAIWKAHNYSIKLELGRNIPFFDDLLTIRPYISLRSAWGQQSYLIQAHILPGQFANFNNSTVYITLRENYTSGSGGGGLWTTLKIGYGFSLVGRVGSAGGYSDWHSTQNLEDIDTVDGLFISASEKDRFPSIGFGVDYYIGLNYTYKCGDTSISAKLGWESATSQQNVINSIGANMGTQGITAGLSAAF